MQQKYLDILGLDGTYTIEQLKRAYRDKAKLYHPDRNKSADAHEKFILLSQAFEYLKAQRENGSTINDPQIDQFAQWWRREEEKIRQRARQQADMDFSEFINSEEYRQNAAINVINDFIQVAFTLLVNIVLPIAFYLWKGTLGLWVSGGIMFVLLPATAPGFVRVFKLKFNKLFPSLKEVLTIKVQLALSAFAATILNVVLLLKYSLNTLINLQLLLVIFIGSTIAAYIIVRLFFRHLIRYWRIFFIYIGTPLVINCFFFFNAILATSSATEVHYFKLHKEHGGYGRTTSMIDLQYGKYDDYSWMRFFWVFEHVKGKNKVTYTIKDGLFGLRVMTDYEIDSDFDQYPFRDRYKVD